MKRFVFLILLFTMSLEAADAVPRKRYLVATLPGAHESAAAAFAAGEGEGRRLRRFEGVHGFAIDLTDAEAVAMAGRSDVRYVEPMRCGS